MALSVEIDARSGFCGGVIRAIGKAEEFLDGPSGRELHSLGAIVHNEAELSRLGRKGLDTVLRKNLSSLCPGETILIRAHGEPPETYSEAAALGLEVIDCTCPVVLKLQSRIREAHRRVHSGGRSGRIIIFGKIGHAEVLGLLGQVGGDASVVENMAMLEELIPGLDASQPVEVFSQTTKDPDEYAAICARLAAAVPNLKVHDTICSQVANRHRALSGFARNHDVIIFVAGRDSSNGKVLFDLCRSVNPRSWHIGAPSEIRPEWFEGASSVGVCGATSTPKWLLEEVAAAICNLS